MPACRNLEPEPEISAALSYWQCLRRVCYGQLLVLVYRRIQKVLLLCT